MNRAALKLILVLVCVNSAAFSGNSAAEQAQALFDGANAVSCLRCTPISPYAIEIQFRLFEPHRMPLDGVYTEIWASPDRWRKNITAGDFQETIVRNQAGQWRMQNGGPEPPEVRLFRDTIDEISEFRLQPGEEFHKVKQERSEGRNLRCVEVRERGVVKRTFCFDYPTVHLQSIKWLSERTRFTNYTPFLSIAFPKQMRMTSRNEQLWDAQVQNIQRLDSLDQSWFKRPSGSEPYVSCINVKSPKAVKTPDGAYDPELSRRHIEGSAILNVEVGSDGKTHHLHIVYSDNPGFANAAYDAIRTWRFQPAMCGDVPVPVVVRIEMNFRLHR